MRKNTLPKEMTLPAIALRNMTVLPKMVMHFDISRKKSIKAVETSMCKDQKIFLVTQKEPQVNDPKIGDLYNVGTIAEIKQIIKLPGKIIRVQVEGLNKAELKQLEEGNEMLLAKVLPLKNDIMVSDELTSKAMLVGLKEMLRQYAAANNKMSRDILKNWFNIEDVVRLFREIMADFPMEYHMRQKFLMMDDADEIYTELAKMIIEEINIFSIRDELTQKVKQRVEKNQKDYYLREQLSVINEELENDILSEIEEYKKAVEELNATDEVKEKLNKEIKRLKSLSGSSSEANVERGYIETCLTLPWNNSTVDNKDIINARMILDEDHYGMKEIKDRIVEALAVRNITDKSQAPIICLVGPPGTGKTSIARSVAKALNKKYVRICLGGVRDEAEIRGHRKTYVGAMPGRIIDGLIKAESSNPLMLLDEIDKISSDYKGDTASALLEVLDSEQNSHFTDHYIELPVDLSNVLFIATANDLSTVSRPLLDRMEIIEVHSYTHNEKMHIAKEHLVKKQLIANGLKSKDLKISDKALDMCISSYTREAGVRGLERQIAKICRKAVTNLYESGAFLQDGTRDDSVKMTVKVTDKNLTEYLGKVKYLPDKKNKKADVGIVRGLAWTSVGGDTLEIEVNTMAGKGELKITGNLGDIMKESAMIALSYVRSVTQSGRFKVENDYYDKHNFHIHVPAGATPKDGPSAGITMATAILSAVTNVPVKADLAMTGEITLRGRVTAIGGLKEKMLAAKKAGITQIIVPKENKSDVEEFDEEITSGLHITYVEKMSQVISVAFVE